MDIKYMVTSRKICLLSKVFESAKKKFGIKKGKININFNLIFIVKLSSCDLT